MYLYLTHVHRSTYKHKIIQNYMICSNTNSFLIHLCDFIFCNKPLLCRSKQDGWDNLFLAFFRPLSTLNSAHLQMLVLKKEN